MFSIRLFCVPVFVSAVSREALSKFISSRSLKKEVHYFSVNSSRTHGKLCGPKNKSSVSPSWTSREPDGSYTRGITSYHVWHHAEWGSSKWNTGRDREKDSIKASKAEVVYGHCCVYAAFKSEQSHAENTCKDKSCQRF